MRTPSICAAQRKQTFRTDGEGSCSNTLLQRPIRITYSQVYAPATTAAWRILTAYSSRSSQRRIVARSANTTLSKTPALNVPFIGQLIIIPERFRDLPKPDSVLTGRRLRVIRTMNARYIRILPAHSLRGLRLRSPDGAKRILFT